MLNEDRFRDLESLGYPEPPKSMLNGESMPLNIVTFHAFCFLQLCCLPLTSNVPCIFNQMALFLLMKMALFWLMKMPLFWLIILKNLLATYVVEVSGMN